MFDARILGTGSFLPERIVPNTELEEKMDTSDEWIQQRTGIRERRYVEEGVGTSDLGLKASQRALRSAGLTANDIDFIIFATLSPDYNFPGCGCLLQDKLGIGNIGALDVRNQCTGFIYSLSIAHQFVRTGTYQHILVVGAEVHSTGLEMHTRGREVAVIFGDGAGAVVVGKSSNDQRKILSSHLHSEGKFAKKLWIEAPSSIQQPRLTKEMLQQGRHYPRMEGRYVFKHAVDRMQQSVREGLEANNLKLSDVKLLILHQANLRISEAVVRALKISPDRVFNNIQIYGNTTAASIPIALDEATRQGKIGSGDLIVLAAFGSGFTWGATVLKW
ncbi:MAG: ketoacyl-ACP synthase III [Acidobacteriia bacterium]|jgi:3-oxoacyl-[acyl-carrier-protein] synthase-3|nr:ketoacyl-ACP synthase III [Terriglobia bacterium]